MNSEGSDSTTIEPVIQSGAPAKHVRLPSGLTAEQVEQQRRLNMSPLATLTEYLVLKYGDPATSYWALSKKEAEAFGIPYPLRHGWPERYAYRTINLVQGQRLVAF